MVDTRICKFFYIFFILYSTGNIYSKIYFAKIEKKNKGYSRFLCGSVFRILFVISYNKEYMLYPIRVNTMTNNTPFIQSGSKSNNAPIKGTKRNNIISMMIVTIIFPIISYIIV